MKAPVVIESYNEEWPTMFGILRDQIVDQLGCLIVRVDHIGSTSVFGLAAKPILDIQISVMDLNNIEAIKNGLESLGFLYRRDNLDLTKRYFREIKGMRRTHIHVRECGSWSEQFNLLFRDYLRRHELERNIYAKVKYELANQYREHREQYIEGKTEIIWNIMMKANQWSQEIGWKPGKPDL